MLIKTSEFKTEEARRYGSRLCKHFSHRVEADWNQEQDKGLVDFVIGQCEMLASEERLTFIVQAQEQADLQEVIATIERHLVRFAQGRSVENCEISWHWQ